MVLTCSVESDEVMHMIFRISSFDGTFAQNNSVDDISQSKKQKVANHVQTLKTGMLVFISVSAYFNMVLFLSND